jgi:hypothetical protein
MVKRGIYLWSQVVQTTVLLTENHRAKAPDVYQLMERVRTGSATSRDIERIQSRIFGHPNGPNPNNSKWRQAILVTSRNAIRQAWNNQAAIRHTLSTKNQLFISPSIDEGLPCPRETMIWVGDNKTEMLATWNVLCIGAEAIVTFNIAVELNIANGSRVINPADTQGWRQLNNNLVFKLTRPPIAVFVEPVESSSINQVRYHPIGFPSFRSSNVYKSREKSIRV